MQKKDNTDLLVVGHRFERLSFKLIPSLLRFTIKDTPCAMNILTALHLDYTYIDSPSYCKGCG